MHAHVSKAAIGILALLTLIASLAVTSPSAAQPPPGSIQASLTYDWVQGQGFADDTLVDIWVEADPDTELPTGSTSTGPGNGLTPGEFFADAGALGGLNLEPGMQIVVRVDGVERNLTLVGPLTIQMDGATTIASGLGPAGTTVDVAPMTADCNTNVSVPVDGSSMWSYDFSTECPLGFGPDPFGQVFAHEPDGDATIAEALPPQSIRVSVTNDWVQGFSMAPDATVEIWLNADPDVDAPLATAGTDGLGNFFADLAGGGTDLMFGDVIVVRDGVDSRELTLESPLSIEVNAENSSASGELPVGETVAVTVTGSLCGDGGTVADDDDGAADGSWSIDLSGTCSVPPGLGEDIGGSVTLFDDNGNATIVEPTPPPPPPSIQASLTNDWVQGQGFADDTLVEVWVNTDPDTELPTGTAVTGPANGQDAGGFFADTGALGGVDLVGGSQIVVRVGLAERDLSLAGPLTIEMDGATTSASGERPAGVPVDVAPMTEECTTNVTVPADGATWSYDFSTECPGGFGPNPFGQVFVLEFDGDATIAESLPAPSLEASLTSNSLFGNAWPAGAAISITIDDNDGLGAGRGPFGATADGNGSFGLAPGQTENIDITGGDVVTATDGEDTKVLNVLEPLTIDISQPVTAEGQRPAGTAVSVYVNGPFCEVSAEVPANGDTYSASFESECGSVGFGPNPYAQVNLWDADGDATIAERPEPPAGEQEQVLPPDATAGDGAGESVDASGNRVIAGRPGADGGQGKADIYEWSGTAWVAVATLLAPDGVPGDGFGTDVAIGGSVAVVGAPAAAGTGKAYVFERDATGAWNHELTIDGEQPGDETGFAVAAYQEGPRAWAVIGSPGANGSAGQVDFYESSSPWVFEIRLTGDSAGDQFGSSVDCDGQDCVVGAPGYDGDQANIGAVYTVNLDNPEQPTDPSIEGTEPNEALGGKAVIAYLCQGPDGDFTQLFLTSNANNIPDAEIWRRPVGDLEAPWEFQGNATEIGAFVDEEADLDISQVDTGECLCIYGPSSAYLIGPGEDGMPAILDTFEPLAGTPDNGFGSAVALSGSLAVVGAPSDDGAGTDAGAVYIVPLGTGGEPPEPELRQIEAYPEDDFVSASWEAEGFDITVERGGAVVYEGSSDYQSFLLWQEGFDLQPGDLVTVSGGEITKDHVVTDQTITLFDPVGQVLQGTGTPGLELAVQQGSVFEGDPGVGVIVDTFAVPASGLWEVLLPDGLEAPGTVVEVGYFEPPETDNDQTKVVAYIPAPTITVRPPTFVEGNGWAEGVPVDISVEVEGVETFTISPSPVPERYGGFPWETTFGAELYNEGSDEGWEVVPGQVVVATDGTATKDHAVVAVTFDELNIEGDTAAGSAPEGTPVEVGVGNEEGGFGIEVIAGPGDTWFADFSSEFDITEDMGGDARVTDDDGDATAAGFEPPPAPELRQIEAYPEDDFVLASWEAEGFEITIERAGGIVYEGGSDYQAFELWQEGFDLQPGDVVTVTGGEVTKDHVVRDQTITLFDPVGQVLRGTGSPGLELMVAQGSVFEGDPGVGIIVDPFVVPASGVWEVALPAGLDEPGTVIAVGYVDPPETDNDSTAVLAFVPAPTITVRPPSFVEGNGWPLDMPVDISIVGEGFAVDPSPVPERIGPFPWETWFGTEFYNEGSDEGWEVVPGQMVSATDGTTTKDHTVVLVTFDELNVEADSAAGSAPEGTPVEVGVGNEEGGFGIEVIAGPGDTWFADFSGEFDVTEDMGGDARVTDDDGDATAAGFEPPPAPRIVVDPFRELILVEGYPDGNIVEVTVEDDAGSTVIGPLYAAVEGFEARFSLLPEGLYIEPGQLVRAVDLTDPQPETTREVWIAEFGVDEVDDEFEVITGFVDPFSGILVLAENETGGGERFIETDDTGLWSADFAGEVDIDKTQGWYLYLEVPDEDNDATAFLPPEATPGLSVEPNLDIITTEGSGLGDITIRVPAFGYESTTTPDHPGSGASIFPGFEFDTFALAGDEVWTYGRALDLTGEIDLAPGMVVEASDILWDMSLTVTEFSVDAVDAETNTVSGFNPLAPEPELGPGIVGTGISGPAAFGFAEPDTEIWTMELNEIVDGGPGDVYDITGTETGLSFGSAISPLIQPYDTYTARFWAPPEITSLELPADPVEVDTVVTLDATFTDIELPDDSHDVVIDWGDGSETTVPDSGVTISETHTYETPGIHTVTLTVTDRIGLFATETFEFVVVYDPNGGFVTGGGSIDSPATGEINFGLNARYRNNSFVPIGQTNIQFQADDMHFQSDSYFWLVVVDGFAIYVGEGSLDGEAGYGFSVLVVDDGRDDSISIQVSDPDGEVVYDTGSVPLSGGSIVVHG